MADELRKFDLNGNLNEYIFARIVEDHNIAVRSRGLPEDQYITAKQGRELHAQWLAEIANYHVTNPDGSVGRSKTPSDVLYGESRASLAKVFGKVLLPDEPFAHMGDNLQVMYRQYMKEWSTVTNIGVSNAEMAQQKANGFVFHQDSVIPCSPFDTQYSGRETVLSKGTQILYAYVGDVLTQQKGEDGLYQCRALDKSLEEVHEAQTQFQELVFLKEDGRSKGEVDVRTSVYDVKPVGPMVSEADISGITRLREFMAPREFEKASRWMEAVPPEQRMTESMVDRSVAILEMLRERGIPYAVKPDQNPGQLKAVIGNTKMSIRVTDTRGVDMNNGLYIGRVYNDGDSMFLTPAASKKQDEQKSAFVPTKEQMIDLISYAMGHSVDRKNSYKGQAGPVGTESTFRSAGAEPKRSTYLSASRTSGNINGQFFYGTTLDPLRPKTPEMRYPPTMPLYIKSSNNHSNAHMDFPSEEVAEDFLRQAIDTARENFSKKVNIDYLIDEHEAHRDDEDYLPIFSGDISIQPIQLTYWNVLRGKQELYRPDGTAGHDHAFDELFDALNLGGDESEEDVSGVESDEVGYQPPSSLAVDMSALSASLQAHGLTADAVSDAEVPGFDEAVSEYLVDTYGFRAKGFEKSMDGNTVVLDGIEWEPAETSKQYVGSPEEVIRAHLKDNVDLMFGSFEPDEDGKRFSPSLVASFMESAHGVPRNKDNLISAMRTLGFTGDELRGNDFETGTVKDKMLQFNPETARPMSEWAQEAADAYNARLPEGAPQIKPEQTFIGVVMNTVTNTLRETACKVDDADVLMDDMGVIHYRAHMMYGVNVNSWRTLEGEIGQIFQPDSDGVVETHYNGSENKLFTPGYDAYIVPETPETKGQPLETRYRFRGMPQILCENIQSQIRYDVHNITESVSANSPDDMVFHTGTTTSVNNTYRGLYRTGYKVSIEQQKDADGKPVESLKDTYLRQMRMTHMPDEVLSSIFATARGMVHFGKDIIEQSSVNAEYRFQQQQERVDRVSVHELTNDNVQDVYELTNHANMAITAENSDRLFDPVMTGSGKNQGAIRYFVVGAGVNADGTPHFSEREGALRAPIMMTSDQVYADYIPADRQQMEISNYMTASGVAGSRTELDENGEPSRGVGVAQLTLQGLTFDDGAVISKDFAEKYGVIGDNGTVRPLMAGDKLCDTAGNKSIIAMVVDRDMPLDEAKASGLDLAVQLFRNNPSLDVVQSPYSAVSRFNAAGVKHAMQNPDDLVMPDGSVHKGCIGFMPMTITHHTAEDHTKGYDEDAVRQGKGRKVSAQQVWMLDARGATELKREVFGPNNNATINFREYLNTIGFDISETGEMRYGYTPHHEESRYMFHMPDKETLTTFAMKDIGSAFNDVVGSRGGILELPFPLHMPSGIDTPELDADKSSRPDETMYALPVMSAHLRSGQAFEDGTKQTHDYTNQYQAIYRKAVEYLQAKDQLADPELSPEKKIQCERIMKQAPKAAQQAYDSIAEDVVSRKIESKHNVARDELMARRMSNSATAVWTPNPMLGVNQVAMSPGLAKTLSVKEGDRVLVNRDPLLRTYGMRDMEVVIDKNLHGVAVHPAIAVSFDGDFDGDSVGLWAPKSAAGRAEAYRLFSFEQNMLDYSRVRENGDYALMFNDSMDIISAEAVDRERHDAQVEALKVQFGGEDSDAYKAAVAELPETLYDRRMRIEHSFNEVFRDTTLSAEERMRRNEELTAELSDYAREVMVPQIGTELISYESPSAHMESLVRVVDHKAKGSMGKLNSYMKFAGFEAEHDADGRILCDTVHETGTGTLATIKDIRDTELATAIKSHGTGIAGSISIRAAYAFRDVDTPTVENQQHDQRVLEAALRLTYLATQGILQAKHDPVKAQMLYTMVSSDMRSAWKGYAMEQTEDQNGMPRWKVKYENGKPVQAEPEDWIKTFMDMHTAPNGLDLGGAINEEDVRLVAAALTGEDGRMVNIEEAETIRHRSSPIDQLAYTYQSGLQLLKDMADAHTNVFDGQMSQYLAPEQIRKNQLAMSMGDMSAVRPLQPADTKAVALKVNLHATPGGWDEHTREVGDVIRPKKVVELQGEAGASFVPGRQLSPQAKSVVKQADTEVGYGFKYDAPVEPGAAEPVAVAKVAEQPAPSLETSSPEVSSRPLPDVSGVVAKVTSEKTKDGSSEAPDAP